MYIKPIETIYNGYRFRSRLEARWAVFFDTLGIKYEYELEGFDLENFGRYLPDFYLPDWNTWIEIKPKEPTPDEILKVMVLHASFIENEQSENKDKIIRTKFRLIYGTPGLPKIECFGNSWKLRSGAICLNIVALLDNNPDDKPITTRDGKVLNIFPVQLPTTKDIGKEKINLHCIAETFAMVNGGKELDIWPLYVGELPKNEWSDEQNFLSLCSSKAKIFIVPTFPAGFSSRMYMGDGVLYNSKNLLDAYNAARQARFEFGETPINLSEIGFSYDKINAPNLVKYLFDIAKAKSIVMKRDFKDYLKGAKRLIDDVGEENALNLTKNNLEKIDRNFYFDFLKTENLGKDK